MTYWFEAKPRAQLEKENLFGLTGAKMGKTITENQKFFSNIEYLQEKADWNADGMKNISLNQVVFFCVEVVTQELKDQTEGKIPLN
mgnify:CR=1 FL=1|tara:strand:+ start:1205 stop:1462 length:258 start_codon:yes stop_codon:yes gene_type:complete